MLLWIATETGEGSGTYGFAAPTKSELLEQLVAHVLAFLPMNALRATIFQKKEAGAFEEALAIAESASQFRFAMAQASLPGIRLSDFTR